MLKERPLMIKTLKVIILLLLFFALSTPAFSVEVAPRISDREIVERLSRLEEGQESLNKRMDEGYAALNKRIDDLRSEMNARFDNLSWLMKLFIGITIVILGFVLRMQWQMNRRQAQMEEALETQKDEMNFLKGLIEKLLPPKGAL
jgi:uncharacterized membrane protein